ncbi:MAG: hypothetical protein QXI10_03910 [Candidatus Diapherotrites archaeon]
MKNKNPRGPQENLRRIVGVFRKLRARELHKKDMLSISQILNAIEYLKNSEKKFVLLTSASRDPNVRSRNFAKRFAVWLGYDLALQDIKSVFPDLHKIFKDSKVKREIVDFFLKASSDMPFDNKKILYYEQKYGENFTFFLQNILLHTRKVVDILLQEDELIKQRN